MGLKDKFAESFAKAQTMSESEKRANEIMSKLIFKKATIPLVLMLVIFIASLFTDITWWAVILINSLIALGTYFYLKKEGQKYQDFKPYMGNLISFEKKGDKQYFAIIKQGKMPIKLEIHYGYEDFEKLKKNQMIQVQYSEKAKVAILVK